MWSARHVEHSSLRQQKTELCSTCERAMKRLGLYLPYSRLQELVEANRDERCYISNIKIGERIYVPDENGKIIGCRIQGISLPAHGKNLILHLGGYPAIYMWQDRENIDWWKNKQEAEAAMKGGNNG